MQTAVLEQHMDSAISKIINKALDGTMLNDSEIAELFRVEDFSSEAYAIQQAGRQLSASLLSGKAEVHGQIGVNVAPCPMDCQFCSFAKGNGVFSESSELALAEVSAGVRQMLDKGANAIYIMETANYPFQRYLELSAAVIAEAATDVPFVANVGDFDADGAQALKAAGFAGIYHAIRMGEGDFTKIPVARRLQTIETARSAGLAVGTCVEPVGPEHTIEELVEKTVLTREIGAVFSGAMRRTQIASSPLAVHGQLSYARMAVIVAAVALATGQAVPGNCTHEPNQLALAAGANLIWAEVGSNPRDTEAETVRGWTVDRCRDLYQECGWDVLDGPSQMFVTG
jgi:biotin synthase